MGVPHELTAIEKKRVKNWEKQTGKTYAEQASQTQHAIRNNSSLDKAPPRGNAKEIRKYLRSLKQGSTLDVRDYVEKNNLTGNEKANAVQNIRRLSPEFSNKKLKVIEIEDTFDIETQKKILTPRDKRRIKKWEKRTGLKYTFVI